MPTYDYSCVPCGHKFEQFVPVAYRDLVNCPQCGKRARRNEVYPVPGYVDEPAAGRKS